MALQKGDYKDAVKEQPGSSFVVQGGASDLGGVGYSGTGYKTSSVRALPLADQGAMYEPSLENCLNGVHPLARFLYIYVYRKPGTEPDKLTYELLNFINSRAGQETVVKDGCFPLPGIVAADTMTMLQ